MAQLVNVPKWNMFGYQMARRKMSRLHGLDRQSLAQLFPLDLYANDDTSVTEALYALFSGGELVNTEHPTGKLLYYATQTQDYADLAELFQADKASAISSVVFFTSALNEITRSMLDTLPDAPSGTGSGDGESEEDEQDEDENEDGQNENGEDQEDQDGDGEQDEETSIPAPSPVDGDDDTPDEDEQGDADSQSGQRNDQTQEDEQDGQDDGGEGQDGDGEESESSQDGQEGPQDGQDDDDGSEGQDEQESGSQGQDDGQDESAEDGEESESSQDGQEGPQDGQDDDDGSEGQDEQESGSQGQDDGQEKAQKRTLEDMIADMQEAAYGESRDTKENDPTPADQAKSAADLGNTLADLLGIGSFGGDDMPIEYALELGDQQDISAFSDLLGWTEKTMAGTKRYVEAPYGEVVGVGNTGVENWSRVTPREKRNVRDRRPDALARIANESLHAYHTNEVDEGGRGPIIYLPDETGSMSGSEGSDDKVPKYVREKMLQVALAKTCKDEDREFISLAWGGNWHKNVSEYRECVFGDIDPETGKPYDILSHLRAFEGWGSTFLLQTLERAIVLADEYYYGADILVVSDGYIHDIEYLETAFGLDEFMDNFGRIWFVRVGGDAETVEEDLAEIRSYGFVSGAIHIDQIREDAHLADLLKQIQDHDAERMARASVGND